jgi:hypothetical protein
VKTIRKSAQIHAIGCISKKSQRPFRAFWSLRNSRKGRFARFGTRGKIRKGLPISFILSVPSTGERCGNLKCTHAISGLFHYSLLSLEKKKDEKDEKNQYR